MCKLFSWESVVVGIDNNNTIFERQLSSLRANKSFKFIIINNVCQNI